jgi:hypothetical protein
MQIQNVAASILLLSAFLLASAHGQSPSPTARDVIGEVIEQAAKESSKQEKPTGQTTLRSNFAEERVTDLRYLRDPVAQLSANEIIPALPGPTNNY